MIPLPFPDRTAAGRLLAERIQILPGSPQAVVLALARGGLPAGFAIAERWHIPLDVLVARKVSAPGQPELALGAVAGGTQVLDRERVGSLRIPMRELHEAVERARAELKQREELYRGAAMAGDCTGRTLILTDDGLATGSTMLAAVRHARSLQPARVMVAVPVGSQEACRMLQPEVDDLICLATPPQFGSVSVWYREFPQVSDAEVRGLLAESRQRLKKYRGSAATA